MKLWVLCVCGTEVVACIGDYFNGIPVLLLIIGKALTLDEHLFHPLLVFL